MNHGNRPTEVEGIAPGTAAADLRAILGTDGAPSWEGTQARTPDQALLEWAGERGRLFSNLGELGDPTVGGVEHEIWFDDTASRVLKITVSRTFGRIPQIIDGRLVIRPGGILSYLDRLAFSNLLFADNQLLLGVIEGEESLRVLTEQPVVVGERPTLDEIKEFME